ncbi:MAG: dienelactone hydrolase family protein [Magnetospiraceae bacterium]
MFQRFVVGLFAASISYGAQAGEAVTYDVNGEPFEGYFAPASSDSKGLVVVVHDWDGMTEYEMKRADMLADMGYDVFALDLFGKGNRPMEMETRRAETGKLYKDRERMRALLLGGLDQARAKSAENTVVMGYCFGGAAILELARSGKAADIAGYVSFHGGLATPEGQSYPLDTPPLLIAHGGADTAVPMSQVADLSAQLEEAQISYEIEVYSGAPHAFTVFGSDRYWEVADKKSWAAFTAFLETQLSGS